MRSVLLQQVAPGSGFVDPVMDAQSVFRAVMMALAEPGIVRPLDAAVLGGLAAPAPLKPATAAILLALADYETPVWLDPAAQSTDVTTYVRFHTGSPLVADPGQAAFAVITDGADLDDLDGFALGSLEYPDQSTALIVQVESLAAGVTWRLTGPGIAGARDLHVSPLHPGLLAALHQNRAQFPQGVDLIFTDGTDVLGLPRSTIVMEA